MSKDRKLTIQLILAAILIIFGIVLLIVGFVAPPLGEIHSSVLVAYGEVSTFAGALIGVDYTYKFHQMKNQKNDESER